MSGQTVLPLFAPLPAALMAGLAGLRRHHHHALAAAGRGDFSRQQELQVLSARLGRLLARQARRSQEDRGFTMLELSLAVDRAFPELRRWSDWEMERRLRLQQRAPAPGKAS